MIPARTLAASIFCVLLSTSLIDAQDLSRYREFQFGMNLSAVATRADVEPSEAKVIHQRPALIQKLEWRPHRFLAASPQADPLKEILFSFYNGQLFRIVVKYDTDRTEGLTHDDMVEAISATYGTATRPAAKLISFSSSHGYNDSEKVMARWQDSQYSFNLFQFSYQTKFGVVAFSKRLDALAQQAIVEAIRLDEKEAPLRKIELQKREAAVQEKARLANKANFRP